jgi:hypothetical protein
VVETLRKPCVPPRKLFRWLDRTWHQPSSDQRRCSCQSIVLAAPTPEAACGQAEKIGSG